MNQPKTAPVPAAKPATVPGTPAPTKIGKEVKKPSRTKFLLGCAGGFVFLFIVFIVLMVLMMSRGGEQNAITQALGLAPAGIKTFLLTIISLAFGFLSLLFFILFLIGLFRIIGAKKSDKETRNKGVKMAVFSLIPMAFVMVIWFVLYNSISRMTLASEKAVAEIVVVSPEDISNLKAPVEITFSGANVFRALQQAGASIESGNWDLDGNGEFETAASMSDVSHLYTRRGVYNVGLQVKVKGEEAPRSPYVQIINIPEATFNAEPLTGSAPLDVAFDASDLVPKGFKVQSLDWDFDGDGKYDKEGPDNLKPKWTYDKIGVYKAHLRVVDQSNNVENYYLDIEVVASSTPLLTAVINATPGLRGPLPLQVRFDATDSTSVKGKIVGYSWDFGDGSDLQEGRSVTHVFEKEGTYIVMLTVEEDSGKTAKTTADVEVQKVSSAPEAKFTSDPAYTQDKDGNKSLQGVLPFKVKFDASDSIDQDKDIVGYQWDFNGDGVSEQEGKKAEYTFDKAGNYQVIVTVMDSEDQKGTAKLAVNVAEPGVKAMINANPSEGTVPLIVQFDGSASSTFNGKIVSYEWDFGDGSPKTITGATISHKYTAIGNYTVKLKVVTNQGENGETQQLVYVREIPLKACFEPSRNTGDAPLAVTFDPKCSTGAIAKYTWDFGDGEQSGSRKPSHTFENPGTYTVTLEVADDKSNVNTYTDVISAQGTIQ